jgi:hypothetical protein
MTRGWCLARRTFTSWKPVLSCFLVFFYMTAPEAKAANLKAATCSRADVGSAISSSTYGDMVVIPAGTCTWNSSLIITKGITLQGAGASSTVITSNVGSANWLIVYLPDATSISNDHPFRLTGLTLDMNFASGGFWVKQNSNTVPMTKLQIGDNVFKNTAGDTSTTVACIRIADGVGTPGQIYGVIYHNTFSNCGTAIQSYANEVYSWNNFTFGYGRSDNVYIEDNTFTGNSAFIFGGHGGRYVSRFNIFNFTAGAYQVTWDVHGNQPGGVYATMGCEIYRNVTTLARSTTMLDDRGGSCMVFQNTSTGTAGSWQVREEFADSIAPTSNPRSQHVSDTYYFLNTHNGNNVIVTETQDCCNAITENRDYFNYVASFTGASGVGAGTLAARPTSCTQGVGYWATDQGNWNKSSGQNGQFYKCTAANTWSLYYVPYIFPHPLRTGVQSTAPAPPTNVRIIR